MMKSKVTIVLVNYNDSRYMEEFFDSIHQQNYENIDVVLVDNASEDNSLIWLKNNEPKATIIALDENVGFGQGCNIGAKWAIDNGAEYILLLNIDTVLKPDLVSKLVEAADSTTVTTALTYCGARDAQEVWYSGGEIDYETANTFQKMYKTDIAEVKEVDFISGCCMMIHRDIFAKVGYFKKEYYLYYEDTDFCVRLRQHNVKMKYISSTSLWHKVGGSSVGENETSCSTQYYVTRNRLLFADEQAEFFRRSNLSVIKSILRERAFFDGKQNEKYQLYVQTAFLDYFKGYFGEGYYGKRLIKEHFYLPNDFYEIEEDGLNKWFWSKNPKARIILANARKCDVVYRVSFEIANCNAALGSQVDIDLLGAPRKKYMVPGHIEFNIIVRAEGYSAVYFNYHGTPMTDIKQGNERELYFQVVNFKARECKKEYFLDYQFLEEEGTDDKINWCTKKNSALYVLNGDKENKVLELNMQAESFDNCVHRLNIYNESGRAYCQHMPHNITIPIELKANSASRFTLKTDAPVINEGERKLCFKLKNISVAETLQPIYFGSHFYPEETDGISRWRWCSLNAEKLYIPNNTEKSDLCYLTFTVGSYTQHQKDIIVRVNGKAAWKGSTSEKCCVLLKLCAKTVTEISIETEVEPWTEGERCICFRIDNIDLQRNSDNYVFDGNFYEIETNNESWWRWSKNKTSCVYLINRNDIKNTLKVSLRLLPLNAKNMGRKYDILLNKKVCYSGKIGDEAGFLVKLPADSISELQITSNCEPEVDGDRHLAYCVHNFNIEEPCDGFTFEIAEYEIPKEGN